MRSFTPLLKKRGRKKGTTKDVIRERTRTANLKYLEDLKILRNCVNLFDNDLTSSGDFARLNPENQECWKRVMEFSYEVYENNPKYQS